MASDAPLLVVGPAWVGDMVMAQPLLAVLQKLHPRRPIDLLAPAYTLPLAEFFSEVREAILAPGKHGEINLQERYRLGLKLRQHRYAQCFVLPNTFKSALIPFWAKIPKRTGWRGELRYGLLNDLHRINSDSPQLQSHRYAVLAQHEVNTVSIPRPRLTVSKTATTNLKKHLGLEGSKPVLILAPGAEYGPAKRWPPSYFSRIAQYWIGHGGAVWVMGTAADREASTVILEHLNDVERKVCRDLTGVTSLTECITLMPAATAVVCNDSGLMHIAAALDLTVVALFGSTSPMATPPQGKHCHPLWLKLSCSPCFQRNCPFGHLNCLKQLMPEQVLKVLPAPNIVH